MWVIIHCTLLESLCGIFCFLYAKYPQCIFPYQVSFYQQDNLLASESSNKWHMHRSVTTFLASICSLQNTVTKPRESPITMSQEDNFVTSCTTNDWIGPPFVSKQAAHYKAQYRIILIRYNNSHGSHSLGYKEYEDFPGLQTHFSKTVS